MAYRKAKRYTRRKRAYRAPYKKTYKKTYKKRTFRKKGLRYKTYTRHPRCTY